MTLVDLAGITKKLVEHKGVRISEKELRDYLPLSKYDEYCDMVNSLARNGIIAPVKSSGSNGMNPPLYKRYSIIKPEADYGVYIPQIRLLHGALNIEGYLADTDKYAKHKYWISRIDSFLKHRAQDLETPLSINERSFQMFGKEKALKEDSELAGVLNFNPGLMKALNYYETPEPFFTYDIPCEDSNMTHGGNGTDNRTKQIDALGMEAGTRNILIVENKDTWYTLRRIMSSGCCSIAGIRFVSLVYGEGKKIARRKDSLTEFNSTFYADSRTCYYYFGDLDYEGICIAHDLIRINSMLRIQVFKPLYIAMLNEAGRLELPLPVSSENQNRRAAEWFVSMFDKAHRDRMLEILESRRYIPQEILNHQCLVSMLNCGLSEY